VGPYRQFLSELDEAPCLARFDTFLARSSKFSIFSGWVLGLLGVVFTSLLDFYRASRSCHEVLNELIPEVLLSTLKSGINTKLQNQHAQVNLLYHGGCYTSELVSSCLSSLFIVLLSLSFSYVVDFIWSFLGKFSPTKIL
jgi:hypothetical protein